jgi:peroxiredoxin
VEQGGGRFLKPQHGAVTPNVRDEAPDFQVIDSTGSERSLGALVAGGPRVLIFYRGHW